MEQWRGYQNSLEEESLEEGLKDKITKAMAGLALAGGLGLASPSKAQAQTPGTISSVERALSKAEIISSDIEKQIVNKFNKLSIKYDISLVRRDVKGLAMAVAKMAVSMGHNHQKGIEKYSQVAVNLLEIGFRDGAGKGPVIDYVKKAFEKRIEKKKPKRKVTVQKYEIRDNPRLVQQAVFGVFLAAGQGESLKKPMDNFIEVLKRAIKDGDLTLEKGKKILNLLKDGPQAQDKINKLLGL
tara:strand:- start:13305 stop:14027 length:723 start_codon:yes stop_codon:yes gene_type:complete